MREWLQRGKNTTDALILLGCILLNLFLTLLAYAKFAYIGTDGVSYELVAKSLAEGTGLTLFGAPAIYFSPLFSVVIVPFYWVMGNIDLAAHITIIVLGFLSLSLFYYAMRLFAERYVAAIATLFLAVNTIVVWKNLQPTAQPLAAFLSVAFFYAFIRFTHTSKKSSGVFLLAAVLGIISGALYLTRPEYFFLILPLVVFIFFTKRREVSWRRNLAIVLVPLGVFCIIAFPYISFLHAHTGQWSFMATSRLPDEVLNEMSVPIPPGLSVSPILPENQVVLVLKHVFSLPFAKSYLGNLLDMEKIFFAAFGIIGFAFFGIGLRRLLLQKKYEIFAAVVVLLFPLFALALGHTGTHGYIMPWLFLFILFISIGCASLVHEIAEAFAFSLWKRRVLLLVLVFVSAAYSAFPLFQNILFRPEATTKPVEYQLLGSWFTQNVPRYREQVIVARKPEIAFYAGTTWEGIDGTETPEEVVALMKKNGEKYVAIDTRSLGARFSRFVDTGGKFLVGGVEFVHDADYYGEHVYLYRLKE